MSGHTPEEGREPGGDLMHQKRWYVHFCNPQTGSRDELWFESVADREQWMKDFRSDFPLLQMATLEDIVRIEVAVDYAGQRITSDSIELIIENRVQNWHVDHPRAINAKAEGRS